jgi:uncharacterized protein YjbJ (UPF0337 family)
MDWEKVANDWATFAGALKSKWSKLTSDDLESFTGKKEFLVAALERRYGIRKDHAVMQVDRWLSRLKDPAAPAVPADGTG